MKKTCIGIGVLAMLGVAAVGVGQGIVRPPLIPYDPREGSTLPDGVARTGPEVARAQREIAEAFRYKGTTAVPDRHLDADAVRVKKVCEMLSSADFVPESRLQRFAILSPRFTIVGWHLTIEDLDVRERDTLVRVRAAPTLRAPGEGTIGIDISCHETYRIAGGRIHFVGSDPIVGNEPIVFGIQ